MIFSYETELKFLYSIYKKTNILHLKLSVADKTLDVKFHKMEKKSLEDIKKENLRSLQTYKAKYVGKYFLPEKGLCFNTLLSKGTCLGYIDVLGVKNLIKLEQDGILVSAFIKDKQNIFYDDELFDILS